MGENGLNPFSVYNDIGCTENTFYVENIALEL